MTRFKDILCVVEPGERGKSALEHALTLAKNHQARLTVVDVVPRVTAGIGMPDGGPISLELQAAVMNEHQQRLAALVEPFRNRLDFRVKVLPGVQFLEIIREVLREGHDLVIKAPSAQDWLGSLFGSDDMHLLRKCPCPVLLVKSEAPRSYRRILAAVDVDDGYPAEELGGREALNLQTMNIASSLALSEFSELHVLHVWDATGEGVMRGAFMSTPEVQIVAYVEQVRRHNEQLFNAFLRKAEANMSADALEYLTPKKHLVKGWARKELPALAKRIDADLVVMGTVGRAGVPGFIMGNTAEAVLNQLTCSVLAIKPQGFVSPVGLES